jgi:hypothetical protein
LNARARTAAVVRWFGGGDETLNSRVGGAREFDLPGRGAGWWPSSGGYVAAHGWLVTGAVGSLLGLLVARHRPVMACVPAAACVPGWFIFVANQRHVPRLVTDLFFFAAVEIEGPLPPDTNKGQSTRVSRQISGKEIRKERVAFRPEREQRG